MIYPVRFTGATFRDLEEICLRVAEHDSYGKAGYVLDGISETAENAGMMPHRGTRPDELPRGLDADYRQVFFKPYRIVYEVTGSEVVIHLIADGRRGLRGLLVRRLIGG